MVASYRHLPRSIIPTKTLLIKTSMNDVPGRKETEMHKEEDMSSVIHPESWEILVSISISIVLSGADCWLHFDRIMLNKGSQVSAGIQSSNNTQAHSSIQAVSVVIIDQLLEVSKLFSLRQWDTYRTLQLKHPILWFMSTLGCEDQTKRCIFRIIHHMFNMCMWCKLLDHILNGITKQKDIYHRKCK